MKAEKRIPESTIEENNMKQENKIRILLMNEDYSSYYHSEVSGSANGKEFRFTKDNTAVSEEMPVCVIEDAGKIRLNSLKRGYESPEYDGSLEIYRENEGFVLINELPVEEYLEGVVPAEMPPSYSYEALKAQAICARTYAYRQMQIHRIQDPEFSGYNADADDSVNFQMYRSKPASERCSNAVRDTYPFVMMQKGELIDAYYFSTSSGMTSTMEVWDENQEVGYLKSVPCSYDSDMPWSHWETEIPWKNIENAAGELFGDELSVESISVIKKTQSNAVTGIELYTNKGKKEIFGEYKVRALFCPRGCIIFENDRTESVGGKLLPSAYITLEVTEGEKVVVSGKGYGHGVGLSQNAANQMAKEGMSCHEILHYFYKDIVIEEY